MVTAIPQELKQEYPFGQNYFSVNSENLHYVDEGQGEPILMLHGNPTWSFYYRNLAKSFLKTNRVIIPDHLGCGLSEKPQDYDYTLNNHIENLSQLILKLNLKNITLIVHDWGGAIGLGFATRYPHLIKKIVAMNTAAFLSDQIPSRINLLRNPVGEMFIRLFNGFAFPATFMATKKGLHPLIKKGYLFPYQNYQTRIATAKFVRDIPLNDSHPSYLTLQTIEKNLKNITCPILLLWGEKDFCFTMNFYNKWKEFFPNAKTKTYPNAGHYLLEDESVDVINQIKEFIKE